MHKSISIVMILSIVTLLFVFPALASQAESMQVWKDITIAHIRIIETTFISPYKQIYGENTYDSGIARVDYKPGRYTSTYEVLEVLAGDDSIEGNRYVMNTYDTREFVSHNAILSSVVPPFQPEEVVVLPLFRSKYRTPNLQWYPSAWNYFRQRSQPAVARPGTKTYQDDLRVMNAIAKVMEAEGEAQFNLLRGHLMGDHPGFATWAIDSLLDEQRIAEPGSVNRRRAVLLLKEIVASPVKRLTQTARSKLLFELTGEDMIEDWLKFVESVATADYTDSPRPTLVLDQIQKAAEFATHSETHKDVRKQVLELFAIALTNTTIPVDHRERLAGQVIQDPEQYRNAGLTNQQAFEVLLEILRQSQEAVIEIAVAESIRDHLRLNFERRMSLELILELIDSDEAAVILEQFLNK